MRFASLIAICLWTSVASAQEPLTPWEGKGKVDKKILFPLIVPKGSLLPPAGKKGKAAVMPLMPGLEVALVVLKKEGDASVLHYVRESDLASVRVAFTFALDNLGKAAERGDYQPSAIAGEDGKTKYVTWSGPFGATFVLLPEVQDLAAKALGSKKIIAAMPQRETLLLVPDTAENTPEQIAELVKENQAEHPSPLTDKLYRLVPGNQKAFFEQAALKAY